MAQPGITSFPSEANMLLVRLSAAGEVPHDTAARVFDGLKARGVLVKNVSAMHPLLAGCLRLTVGTPEENQRLMAALTEALAH
jgi:histidinol-phosphate aminotransferase